LGFGDDKYLYFDSAPAYAVPFTYIPLLLLFPEARTFTIRSLLVALVPTFLAWYFTPERLGFEANAFTEVITVGLPLVGYILFYVIRAAPVRGEKLLVLECTTV